MEIVIRHVIEFGPDKNRSRIEHLLSLIAERLNTMSAELDRLSTEVTEIGGVVDSAVALINGLAEQIRQLKTDPAALAALADSLDGKANELAAAVTANTPAEPAPEPAPPVE